MPAHTRALMFSRSTSDSRWKLREGPDLLLCRVNGTRSVPKKRHSVVRIEPAAQLWPDGYSGNGGVTSGACPAATGVAASNNGVQLASATVREFPSVSAPWMAVIGRQKFQRYLLFQQPIAASAAARLTIANIRALSAIGSARSVAMVRKARFHSAKAWSCQKIAASVSSGVRV